MPRVSLIIVNWNAGELIKKTLSALKNQTYPIDEVIVVDNASTDSSADDLEKWCPGVKVVRLNENIGFAAANNYAARLVADECNWIALLNPDAIPETAWLESLVDAVKKYSGYAFLGSRLLMTNEPATIDGTGDIYHVSGLVWRDGHGVKADASEAAVTEIFSPCAAAALYRRDAFLEANGFDDDFFCYVEDVDLGFRLRLLGYRCLYVPYSVVRHVGSATTGSQHSDFAVYHGHRNLVWTYVKNMPGLLFWLFLPLHLALNFVTCIYFLWMGQGRTIFRSKRDALKGLAEMWRKRRSIQSCRRASVIDIWRALDKSILLNLLNLSKTNLWFYKGVK